MTQNLILAVSLYVFVYAAVMLDSQRRKDELSENAVTQRKWYSSLTLIVAFFTAAYSAYSVYSKRNDMFSSTAPF